MRFRFQSLFVILSIWLLPAAALSAQTIEVDVELVLAVDVSRSMSPEELDIQRRGYAEALVSNEVIDAISDGLLGRVAIQYVEWAGQYNQRIIVDWTLIEDRADAQAFARQLLAHRSPSMSRTSISGGINFAVNAISTSAYSGNRRIIDISGDGPNNQGPYVVRARDEALAAGIIINGLPLMTRDGIYSQFDIERLDLYYRDCVIGGPGAFLIPVLSWEEFPEAVRRKIVLELAGHASPPARIMPTSSSILDMPGGESDCLIGEKIWEQNRWMWTDP
ncbi:MAG: DUF1194 domain-containing protein [Roseitalea porphyridii]|jgi:hypothetical protein|uniref:DUF1194 domain-containing protein n=1 Tax=Roseitalea porphyridii TaxID=1852022 RepID=UPI0032F079A0